MLEYSHQVSPFIVFNTHTQSLTSIYAYQPKIGFLVRILIYLNLIINPPFYLWIYLFKFLKKILFIYSWETHRERQKYRQRERQAPCKELDAGLHPGTPGSWPGPKVGAKLLNHPGIPWWPRSWAGLLALWTWLCLDLVSVWTIWSGWPSSSLCLRPISPKLFGWLLTPSQVTFSWQKDVIVLICHLILPTLWALWGQRPVALMCITTISTVICSLTSPITHLLFIHPSIYHLSTHLPSIHLPTHPYPAIYLLSIHPFIQLPVYSSTCPHTHAFPSSNFLAPSPPSFPLPQEEGMFPGELRNSCGAYVSGVRW